MSEPDPAESATGQMRCPYSSVPGPAAPPLAGRSNDSASPPSRASLVSQPASCKVRWHDVMLTADPLRPGHLVLDHPLDCIIVTDLPPDATIEFPALAHGSDARDIDFGSGNFSLQARHAPLPGLTVATIATAAGGTAYLINRVGATNVLRVVFAGGAAPRAMARLVALHQHAERAERIFQTYLRLLRSGLAPTHWVAPLVALAGQYWTTLPVAIRTRVAAYYANAAGAADAADAANAADAADAADAASAAGLDPLEADLDLPAALAHASSTERLSLLLDLLASALGYWLQRTQLDQVPASLWDRQIVQTAPPHPTDGDFTLACQRLLQHYRQSQQDQRMADESADLHRLAAQLADPLSGHIEIDRKLPGVISIAELEHDVTLKLVGADAQAHIEFSDSGGGRLAVHAERSSSLVISLAASGYRLPRHLVSDLDQDAQGGRHGSVTGIRRRGGLILHAAAGAMVDTARWHQIKLAADFRLEMTCSNLLEWSTVLARRRRLTREQDLRLFDHIQEMCCVADRWTVDRANILLDEMNSELPTRHPVPVEPGAMPHAIALLQRLQVAQVQLYLCGGLLRPLAPQQWRMRVRRCQGLALIAERIVAVQVDCAWEAMDADLHYQALCGLYACLERDEPDPLRRHVLSREGELLASVLQLVAGEFGHDAVLKASGFTGIAGEPQRRLMMKIVLLGSLEGSLFSGPSRGRRALLEQLRHEGVRPPRGLNLNDLALIGFLRDTDIHALQRRVRSSA